MLSVRELKELTHRLDVATLERQLGPFVLVQRPILEARGAASPGLTTRRLPNSAKPAPAKGVFDFEDLWVATLPPMSARDAFVLGRSPDCDVIIDEEPVSKRHARIDWLASEATLEDLGSSNGVFLNSVRLRQRQVLADNDLLSLGAVHMFFMHVATLRRRMGLR
jgi:FHA domain